MSALLNANKIYNNARVFKPVHTKLSSCIVDEFIAESGRWFALLNDDVTDDAKQVRMKIWNLRTTVTETLLPFDSPNLALKLQAENLKRLAENNPNMTEHCKSLSAIVDYMLSQPLNPKREILFTILDGLENRGKGTAIVVASGRMSASEWTNTFISEIRTISPKTQLLLNSRMLTSGSYQQIILPSGGKYCPFINELYLGYLAEQLDVITYQRERSFIPIKTPLPEGSLKLSWIQQHPAANQTQEDSEEVKIDQWGMQRYWESIRGIAQKQLVNTGDEKHKNFMIKARLLILGGKAKTFLQDDTHVIEISDLIEGRTDLERMGKRFPRRLVSLLSVGDLIVLRTSGSGDYLIDVAKALMANNGKSNLYDTALSWKKMLKCGLENYGSEYIASCLAKKGFKIKGHKYIWMWTTDQVIRPQSQSLFYELIGILEELDCSENLANPLSMVDGWWKEMKDIIRYHMLAGREIRNSLLNKLSEMVNQRVMITDKYSLTLPGVNAGEMAVFRVNGIDTSTVEIPYYHTGIVIGNNDINP